MNKKNGPFLQTEIRVILTMLLSLLLSSSALAADLNEIKEKGVIRHLGIPYANFVSSGGVGLDMEMVKLFAQHLGVKYEYVETSWESVIGDLTGKKVKAEGDNIEVLGDVPVKGDIVANGFTIIPWREKIVDFSTPTFPSQIWLMAKADSPVQPIVPHEEVELDISRVRGLLNNRQLLGKANTCLDPSLYDMKGTGAKICLFQRSLNDLAPAVIQGEAELTLLDFPDALVALEHFPGKIKVIGPITPKQYMGCAFAKASPQLRDAFNQFFKQIKGDGTYMEMVKRYYPLVFSYFREFFEEKRAGLSGK
jgi:ABC-type amino acid transport substrate-binding protein